MAHDELAKRRVLHYLSRCAHGRRHAVSARILALKVGLNERAVREVIHDLRAEGHLIASGVDNPAGFYIPATKEEAEVCSHHLWARVREIATVARHFDAAAARSLGLDRNRYEQITLVFGDAERS